MEGKALSEFQNFFSVKWYAKSALKQDVAMHFRKSPMYDISAQYIIFWNNGKPTNFTSVIEASCEKVGPGRVFLGLSPWCCFRILIVQLG